MDQDLGLGCAPVIAHHPHAPTKGSSRQHCVGPQGKRGEPQALEQHRHSSVGCLKQTLRHGKLAMRTQMTKQCEQAQGLFRDYGGDVLHCVRDKDKRTSLMCRLMRLEARSL